MPIRIVITLLALLLTASLGVAGPVRAQPAAMVPQPPTGDLTPVDYAKDASWICRPGVDRGRPGEAGGTCSANLDALVVDKADQRSPLPYRPAAAPRLDCFYVYPTVSNDPTFYSDLDPGAAEELRAVHGQAARLGSVCRVFAPIYHQLTNTALRWVLRAPMGADHDAPEKAMDPAYRDVLAAWRSYLARDNQGRGVILVGHSQGAILLKRLIAEEIDGKPAQRQFAGAYLAGNTGLTAASFRTIDACTARGATGCVIAWSSYAETATGPRFFGDGKDALCVNPAAPGGGRAPVKAFLSRPRSAPPSDPPYVEAVGQLSAECVRDAAGAVLRIRIEPGPHADLLKLLLDSVAIGGGWGLHALDVPLVQGDILDDIAAQAAAWKP